MDANIFSLSGKEPFPGAIVYLGEVTNNVDPDNQGKVEVFLPQLHKDKNTATLPWAYPVSIGYGGGTGSKKGGVTTKTWGTLSIPQIGELVVLLPLYGDMSTLLYIGSLHNGYQNWPNTPDQDTWLFTTPNGEFFRFRYGTNTSDITLESGQQFYLLIDDTNQKIELATKLGSDIVLDDKNKKIVIHTHGGQSITMDDNAKSTIITTAGGISVDIDDTGNKATITAGGAVLTLDKGADSFSISAGGATITGAGGIINLN